MAIYTRHFLSHQKNLCEVEGAALCHGLLHSFTHHSFIWMSGVSQPEWEP